jgi:hypothetical protein
MARGVREFGWGEVSSGPQPISQRGEQMSGRLVVTGHQGGRPSSSATRRSRSSTFGDFDSTRHRHRNHRRGRHGADAPSSIRQVWADSCPQTGTSASAGEQHLLAANGHFHVRQWAVFHVRRHSCAQLTLAGTFRWGCRTSLSTRRSAVGRAQVQWYSPGTPAIAEANSDSVSTGCADCGHLHR